MVHIEATWVCEIDTVPAEPTFRVAVFRHDGVMTENDVIVEVAAGPTEMLTEIGNGATPKWRTTSDAISDEGREAELNDLLENSPLHGAVIPDAFNGVVSTGATEVSEEAVLCALEGRSRDQVFLQQLAREEVRDARRVRRTYAWFFCEPNSDDSFLRRDLRKLGMPSNLVDQFDEQAQVPVQDVDRGAIDDLIAGAVDHLSAARFHDDIVELPLRTIALLDEPTGADDLDQLAHEPGVRWPHWRVLFPFMDKGPTDLE